MGQKYYAVILAQDENSIKLSELYKDLKFLRKLYPKAKIVEVRFGEI